MTSVNIKSFAVLCTIFADMSSHAPLKTSSTSEASKLEVTSTIIFALKFNSVNDEIVVTLESDGAITGELVAFTIGDLVTGDLVGEGVDLRVGI